MKPKNYSLRSLVMERYLGKSVHHSHEKKKRKQGMTKGEDRLHKQEENMLNVDNKTANHVTE